MAANDNAGMNYALNDSVYSVQEGTKIWHTSRIVTYPTLVNDHFDGWTDDTQGILALVQQRKNITKQRLLIIADFQSSVVSQTRPPQLLEPGLLREVGGARN